MITRYQKTALTALAGVSLLGIVTGCSTGTDTPATSGTPGANFDSTAKSTASPDAAAGSSTYTDGEYSAEGEYTSPGGKETVKVSLTLSGDVIKAVTVTPESTNPNGQKYQSEFAEGISDVVVGKKIDDISVTKVAGSSLTSGGFKDAVDKIKADAGV